MIHLTIGFSLGLIFVRVAYCHGFRNGEKVGFKACEDEIEKLAKDFFDSQGENVVILPIHYRNGHT